MKALLYKELKDDIMPYLFINIFFIIATIFFKSHRFLEIALLIYPLSNLFRNFYYDESSKFEKIVIVIESDRKKLVLSKYIVFFLYIVISLISILTVYLISGNNIINYISPLGIITFTGLLVIPSYFKFGKKYMFIIGGFAYIFSIICFILSYKTYEIFGKFETNLILFVINLVIFFISLVVSINVVKNKDF